MKLKPYCKPSVAKRRPLPFAMRDKVSAELERLMQEDIIERIDASEWVSPNVVVAKANSDDIRL